MAMKSSAPVIFLPPASEVSLSKSSVKISRQLCQCLASDWWRQRALAWVLLLSESENCMPACAGMTAGFDYGAATDG